MIFGLTLTDMSKLHINLVYSNIYIILLTSPVHKVKHFQFNYILMHITPLPATVNTHEEERFHITSVAFDIIITIPLQHLDKLSIQDEYHLQHHHWLTYFFIRKHEYYIAIHIRNPWQVLMMIM